MPTTAPLLALIAPLVKTLIGVAHMGSGKIIPAFGILHLKRYQPVWLRASLHWERLTAATPEKTERTRRG